MSKARRIVAAGTGSVLLLGTLSACAQASPFGTVKDFLIAWQVGNYDAAAKQTDASDKTAVANALRDVRTQLDAASLRLRLKAETTATGAAEQKGRIDRTSDDEAFARFNVRIDLGENGRPWSYLSGMPLKRIDGKWKVVWSESVIHPSLKAGGRLAVVTDSPRRQQILDADGNSLLKRGRTSLIEVLPAGVKDVDAVAKAIGKASGQDANRLRGRILSAPPRERLLLATLDAGDPEVVGLNSLPGVFVTPKEQPTEPRMAKELLGSVGPATTDLLTRVGAPYQPGDTVGESGLQLLFQRRLAGTPTVKIVALDANGSAKVVRNFGDDDTVPTTDPNAPGPEPKPVSTTIEPRLQAKAENALRGLNLPASIVTVRGQTGEIVAAANVNTGDVNKAFLGQYAPGTTISPMLAWPLLSSGITQTQPCQASSNVGGVPLSSPKNKPKATIGANLAAGCSTGIANLASGLSATSVDTAIESFGLDLTWDMSGVEHNPAVVPTPGTETEKVKTILGEGGITVSPLTMALIASAIQTNSWHSPQLISDPEPVSDATARTLPRSAWKNLDAIMRAGARPGGSGYNPGSVRRLQGGVAATVTQQDGKTVSWFVGYNKDSYGFAIAVEGNYPVAKLAADFLNADQTLPQPDVPATPTVPGTNTPA